MRNKNLGETLQGGRHLPLNDALFMKGHKARDEKATWNQFRRPNNWVAFTRHASPPLLKEDQRTSRKDSSLAKSFYAAAVTGTHTPSD